MLTPSILVSVALLVLVYMTLWFVVGYLARDNSLVDIGWGPGFLLIALCTLSYSPYITSLQLVTTLLVMAWGLRLSFHIIRRKQGEDWRYAAWRKAWGAWFLPRSYLQIYVLQGLFMLIISLPIILINTTLTPTWNFFSVFGLLLWIFGFTFETVADRQLELFKKHNKGLCTKNLWSRSRHPNYFGEALLWWGIAFMAFPYGLAALLGALAITYLLRYVSIPMLERNQAKKKGWEQYARQTPVFFPR